MTKTHSPRVALYSHDTMGLGHMRRNLLIARALRQSVLNAKVLMIAGAQEANAFALPHGVDCLTLPAVSKDSAGNYHSRHLSLTLREVVRLRGSTIRAAVDAFGADFFIVDKAPCGVANELVDGLESLRARGTTRCILGLRDILDDPQSPDKIWGKNYSEVNTIDAIRNYFDEIWIYGDRQVFDPLREYGFPSDLMSRVRFTGYLNQREHLRGSKPPDWMKPYVGKPFVLCTVGGGQDGGSLATAFLEAVTSVNQPAVLLTGPFMPSATLTRLKQRAAGRRDIHICEFAPEADWLVQRAKRVIAMGGYNTMCSVISFSKPALIVPRVFPRKEQLVRAERFQQRGWIEMLNLEQLTPDKLCQWMMSPVGAQSSSLPKIDLDGLNTICRLIQSGQHSPSSQNEHDQNPPPVAGGRDGLVAGGRDGQASIPCEDHVYGCS